MNKRRFGTAVALFVGILTACGAFAAKAVATGEAATDQTSQEESQAPKEETKRTDSSKMSTWRESVQRMFEDPYGDYLETGGEIAFVAVGPVEDGAYNEAVYNGVRMYALGSGTSFSYYNVESASSGGCQAALERAAAENAGLIVCAGDAFGRAVGAIQEKYPQVSFLLIDSQPMDEAGEPLPAAGNVHSIAFREEQAGYLAGYMAVWEGYRSLGFVGGKEEPDVQRYGYGYLQGIDAAARDLSLTDVKVNYWYAGTFSPNDSVRKRAARWYAEGVQVIFACGGLYASVLEAAEAADGLLIGSDVDRSRVSKRFLTSAVKNIGQAVITTLDDYYAAGGWSAAEAGQLRRFGVEEGCAAIPVVDTEWRFKEIPATHFFEIYKQMKRGDRAASEEIETLPEVAVSVQFE